MSSSGAASTPSESSEVDPRLSHHGALSYLHIPAVDPQASARFYGAVFGWTIHNAESDRPGFEDGSGHLGGAWVTNQAPSLVPGLLPYIYVDDIDTVISAVVEHGGTIVGPKAPEGNLEIATFADPAGNVIGLWEETS